MNSDEINLKGSLEKALEPTPGLSEADFNYFCEAIERIAGISLKSSKRDLVKTRLRSRLLQTGKRGYLEYRRYLQSLPDSHEEWQYFINILTTNKTDFFREPQHFEYLVSTVLPEWLKTKSRDFQVWSAASSTGEEAYTLAMILDKHLPKDRSFHIYGTDIDSEVIKCAKNAVYTAERCSEIPPDYRQHYLDLGRGSVKNWFRIKKGLIDHVSFDQHNLIDPRPPCSEKFDLILCRNVLIYFAQNNIDSVCKKLYSMTKEQGYLFIGHSESFQGIKHSWTTVAPSIYKKR